MRGLVVLLATLVASAVVSAAAAAPVAKGPAYAWGSNTYGQLGYAGSSTAAPTKVGGVPQAIAVAAGQRHTLVVARNGNVWAFGDNSSGQLGTGTVAPSGSSPVQVVGLGNVVAVAAGWDHSLAVRSDGTVWAWGANYYGQLGDGTSTPSLVPQQVPGLTGIVTVAANVGSSFALGADGTLWSWGGNSWGQLGDGTRTDRSSPAPVLTNVSAVSEGEAHTLAVRSDGSVWGWGADFSYQLAYAPDPTDPHPDRPSPAQIDGITGAVGVAAGYDHSLAVLANGSVLAWGDDSNGELGIGSNNDYSVTPVTVPGLTNIASVAAGENDSLALGANGHAWGFGGDNYGQLGNGYPSDTEYNSPVEVAIRGLHHVSAGEFHTAGF
jgi:alpha-tubulin suppressor-like RCC1 family protein